MPNKKMAYLYLTITLCAWGSLYVVSKFVLARVPTFTVLFIRYFIAGIVLLFVLRRKNISKIEKQDYKYVFFIGFIGYFLSIVAQFLGTKFSNASLASLINSTNPIFIILFAVLILKEKLTLHKIICVIAALTGTYIIIGGGSGSGHALGILLSVISVILWSLMTVIVRKITQKYNPIQITTYAIIIAAICSLPASIYELIVIPNIELLNPTVIISLLYIGLVCTALSHVLWNKSLSMIEAGSCSLFYPLQPMVSVLLGWLLLGEEITIRFALGAILIIGGILFSVVGNNNNNEISNQEIDSVYLKSDIKNT